MDERELRMGNWVKFEDWYYQIESLAKELPTLDTPEFGIGVVDWNNLKPIPLTEEWLLKFGFDKREDKFYLLRFLIEKGISQYFDNGLSFRITTSNSESTHAASIKFVHQLQNLYFALTGEELEPKTYNPDGTFTLKCD